MKLNNRSSYLKVQSGKMLLQMLNFIGIRNLVDVTALITNCESRGRELGAAGNSNVGIHAFKLSGKPEVSEPLQGPIDLGCAPKAGFLQDRVGAQRDLLLLKHVENPLLVWRQTCHIIYFPQHSGTPTAFMSTIGIARGCS